MNPDRIRTFVTVTLFPPVFALGACALEPADDQHEEDATEATPVALAQRVVAFADFDGNGILDRVTRNEANQFLIALATAPNVYGPERSWVQHGGPWQDPQQAQYIDLNGDRRADLSYRGVDNSFWISISAGNGFVAPAKWVQHGGGYHPNQAKFADLNADGRMDLSFQGLDNSFWISLSAGTGFVAPQKWFQHGGTYADGQTTYSDLNGDRRADLTFHGGGNTDWISYSTGTAFQNPFPRDRACGSAFGCLVISSAGLPARSINTDALEPHHYQFPNPVVADLGQIKAGEQITVTGYLRSVVLSGGGYGPGTDTGDYFRVNVPAGVTVSGSTANSPNQHFCSSGTYTHYADIATDPFPWSTVGYVRADFYTPCQPLGSDLYAPYTVNLQASRGQIFIRADGPGGPYRVTSTRGVFGVPQGTYTIRAGTDADADGVLCESGDFCATTTVTVGGRANASISVAPR